MTARDPYLDAAIEEALLRSRGVDVQVLQDPACIRLMQDFIASRPELCSEDIGEP